MCNLSSYPFLYSYSMDVCTLKGFLGGSAVKNLPAMQESEETWIQPLDREDPLKKGMATHSSILAWRIPWTEEPGRLQSMESQRVRHNWKWLSMHACPLKQCMVVFCLIFLAILLHIFWNVLLSLSTLFWSLHFHDHLFPILLLMDT